jgi:DMSO/TMAO reductase YedYZ heme-binding membrane subunit
MKLKNDTKIIIITLLILNSFGVFLVTPIDISSGAYPGGIFHWVSDETIPAYHVLAEFLTAAFTLVGMYGWLKSKSWGRGMALFGLGMFCYSSVNSIGWAMRTNPVLIAPMIFTLILAMIAIPMLLLETKSRIEPTAT